MVLTLIFFRKVLFVIFIISLVYTVSFFFIKKNYSFETQFKNDTTILDIPQQLSPKEQPDYASFLKEIENKEVFVTTSSKDSSITSKIDREKLSKIIERLRLVGILSGEPRKAVIEDKKMDRTFYLRKGESFLEGIKVENITKNSVILNFYGEKFELYL